MPSTAVAVVVASLEIAEGVLCDDEGDEEDDDATTTTTAR
jgi:hypothetical protein